MLNFILILLLNIDIIFNIKQVIGFYLAYRHKVSKRKMIIKLKLCSKITSGIMTNITHI